MDKACNDESRYITDTALGGTTDVGRANERALLAEAERLGRKVLVTPWASTPDEFSRDRDIERWPDDGNDVIVIQYGYGGDSVYVRNTMDNKELVETVCALSSYPVIDDRVLAEVQDEDRHDAWDRWLNAEVRTYLDRKGLLDDFDGKFDAADAMLEKWYLESEHGYWDYENESTPDELLEEIEGFVRTSLSAAPAEA